MACEHRCALVKISMLGEINDSDYNDFSAGPNSENLDAQDKFVPPAPFSTAIHTSGTPAPQQEVILEITRKYSPKVRIKATGDSKVESTGCFSRRPELGSQHPHCGSQLSITPIAGT